MKKNIQDYKKEMEKNLKKHCKEKLILGSLEQGAYKLGFVDGLNYAYKRILDSVKKAGTK